MFPFEKIRNRFFFEMDFERYKLSKKTLIIIAISFLLFLLALVQILLMQTAIPNVESVQMKKCVSTSLGGDARLSVCPYGVDVRIFKNKNDTLIASMIGIVLTPSQWEKLVEIVQWVRYELELQSIS